MPHRWFQTKAALFCALSHSLVLFTFFWSVVNCMCAQKICGPKARYD